MCAVYSLPACTQLAEPLRSGATRIVERLLEAGDVEAVVDSHDVLCDSNTLTVWKVGEQMILEYKSQCKTIQQSRC